jgi:GNAT superfamily N-acetyltransferase
MDTNQVTIRLLEGERSEMEDLQRVIEEAPTYAQLVTGVPPGPADAQSTYTILPEGKSYDDKFVFGIYHGGKMVGCADLVRGHPTPRTAYLGLLLISEKHQRRGIGRVAFRLLEDFVRSWGTCDRIRLAVVRTNAQVVPFWEALGFDATGEIKPYRYGSVASESVLFEKRLA